MKKTILIVDNQPLFVEGLKALISKNFSTEKVLESDDVAQAYQLIKENSVDLILADIDLKNGNGLDLISKIRSYGNRSKVLFISSKGYEIYSSLSQTVGAQGYISKFEDKDIVIGAISNVLKGYSVFKTLETVDLSDVQLSKREVSVLDYLKKGYSNKQISDQLSLSEKTVSTYKSRILKKYNTDSLVHVLNAGNIH